MKTNMGKLDKTLRVMAAVTIFILFFEKIISGTVAIVLLVVAGIFLLTSLVGFCPIYKILGISSRKKKTEKF